MTTFLQFPWLYSCCVSVAKDCACVIKNSSAKQSGWLSLARPAPFRFPIFFFPGKILHKLYSRQSQPLNIVFTNWSARAKQIFFKSTLTLEKEIFQKVFKSSYVTAKYLWPLLKNISLVQPFGQLLLTYEYINIRAQISFII